MFSIMFGTTAYFLTVSLGAALAAWLGDLRNESRARYFEYLAAEIRPRKVVGGFFVEGDCDDPTDEVPLNKRGSHPDGICPPMVAESNGLAQVMAEHLRKRRAN